MSKNNITYLTDVVQVTCVVPSGMGDVIIKTARDIGAITGATSYYARGYGARERLGMLGIAVEAEKEIVNVLVSTEQQDTVCNSIFQAARMGAPGNGYLYVTPLDKLATYVPEEIIKDLEAGS